MMEGPTYLIRIDAHGLIYDSVYEDEDICGS